MFSRSALGWRGPATVSTALVSTALLSTALLSTALIGTGCADEVVGTVTPAIRVEPERVDLGLTPLGALAEHEVRAISAGTAVLTIRSVTLGGPGGAAPPADLALALTETLPKVLSPQQALILTVQHLPRDNVADSGVLRIESDDPARPFVEVPILQVASGAPAIAAVPDLEAAKVEANTPAGVSTFVEALHLGQVDVGLRKSTTVHLVNVGDGNVPLDLTRARLVDADAELTVALDPVLPVSLPGLGLPGIRPTTTVGVRVDVSWAPSRAGQVLMNTLRIESNDPARSPLDIPITGNTQIVDPPVLRIEPAGGLDFGTVRVGQSTQRSFTLHNDGTGPLPIMPLTISSTRAFGFTSAPPALTIPAGGMRSFAVDYRPLVDGSDAATVRIASSHPSITAVDYPLSGAGDEVVMCVRNPPDPREPANEACGTATDRGVVVLPNNTEGVTTVTDGALEAMGDSDWNAFRMEVDIGCDFVVGYEVRADVQLASGEQAEVCLVAGDCGAPLRRACGMGSVRTTLIVGANNLCQSSNNAAPVFVEVRHTGGEPTCQPYTLTFGAR